jgi:hypothetical protein
MCCSEFGFCGNGAEYCGGTPAPPVAPEDATAPVEPMALGEMITLIVGVITGVSVLVTLVFYIADILKGWRERPTTTPVVTSSNTLIDGSSSHLSNKRPSF